jgi:hypothetical protein
MGLLFFSAVMLVAFLNLARGQMPSPFYREIKLTTPAMTGNDILIAQTFLSRDDAVDSNFVVDGVFGVNSDAATRSFQKSNRLPETGVIDSITAQSLLDLHSADGYKDSGFTAASMGYLYKINIPVHKNRSIETYGTLFDKDNNKLLTFRVREHGHREYDPQGAWPDFGNGDEGLNEFSSSGNTVTGLVEIDLNSPEPDPALYGPWPVNRVVRGLEGNALLSKNYCVCSIFFQSLLLCL